MCITAAVRLCEAGGGAGPHRREGERSGPRQRPAAPSFLARAAGLVWEPSAYSRRPRSSSSNDDAGSWSSSLSHTSTRPGVSGGYGCAAATMSAQRVLIQAAGCNLELLLRRLTAVGTPRSLQGRALAAICGTARASDRLLDASDGRLGYQLETDGARRLNSSPPSCLNGLARLIDFCHGPIPKRFGFDAIRDIQVLYPMNRGGAGAPARSTSSCRLPSSRPANARSNASAGPSRRATR